LHRPSSSGGRPEVPSGRSEIPDDCPESHDARRKTDFGLRRHESAVRNCASTARTSGMIVPRVRAIVPRSVPVAQWWTGMIFLKPGQAAPEVPPIVFQFPPSVRRPVAVARELCVVRSSSPLGARMSNAKGRECCGCDQGGGGLRDRRAGIRVHSRYRE